MLRFSLFLSLWKMSGRSRNSTERPLGQAVVYRLWQIWRTSVLWCWAWSLRGVLTLLLLLSWTLQHTQKNNTQALWQMYVHIHAHKTHAVFFVFSTHLYLNLPCACLFLSYWLFLQAYWIRLTQADIKINAKPCDVCPCFEVKLISNQLSYRVDPQAWLYTNTSCNFSTLVKWSLLTNKITHKNKEINTVQYGQILFNIVWYSSLKIQSFLR